MDEGSRYWRQLDLINHTSVPPITVIGAGGIGSPVVLTLAKMGVQNILVVDPDVVEDHNLPNQFYRESDIGMAKVEALRDIVKAFTGTTIQVSEELWDPKHMAAIIISTIDNMAGRKKIFEDMMGSYTPELFIDGRMGGLVGRVLTVHPGIGNEVSAFQDTLYTDEEAEPLRCTEQAIIFTVMAITAAICAEVWGFVTGKGKKTDVYVDMRSLLVC